VVSRVTGVTDWNIVQNNGRFSDLLSLMELTPDRRESSTGRAARSLPHHSQAGVETGDQEQELDHVWTRAERRVGRRGRRAVGGRDEEGAEGGDCEDEPRPEVVGLDGSNAIPTTWTVMSSSLMLGHNSWLNRKRSVLYIQQRLVSLIRTTTTHVQYLYIIRSQCLYKMFKPEPFTRQACRPFPCPPCPFSGSRRSSTDSC
jgi:hypothetical protein